MNADRMKKLLRLAMATDPLEIDCDELLARVGAFLECRERDGSPSPELRGVAQHLEVCGECSEELQALLRAHESEGERTNPRPDADSGDESTGAARGGERDHGTD